jgi:hypothetical protein
VAAGIDHVTATVEGLGGHDVGDGLRAASRQVRLGSFGSAVDVAAPPARLGQVDECLAVERAGAGHVLELGPRQGNQAATQVESSQPRIC